MKSKYCIDNGVRVIIFKYKTYIVLSIFLLNYAKKLTLYD